ncbi:MAG: hypothetical protein GY861_06030 [bacterium]|nr:hypothetical protein [bacterium]
MKKLRKIFTISVMMMTVLSMSVVVAPNVDAAASGGDLIKMDGLSSVYYLGADEKRYVFPNEATYFSWYSDWSGVVTIPQAELEGYPLGANVTMRPGTKLVKITTNPKVYAVESNGVLRAIPDEATAKALYGDMWAQRVVDVPDAFFTNYDSTGADLAAAHPEGTMVQRAGEDDVYYIDADGMARKVANEAAMMANRLQTADVVAVAADYELPTAGDELEAADETMIDTSQGGGAGVVGGIEAGAGTGLTVALASDTPASATVVLDSTNNYAQAYVPFTKVNFVAANDGDVKVTQVRYKRGGISANTDLDAMYLYDGETRLTEGATVSGGYVSFTDEVNGLFTVPAGTTMGVTLMGDMYADAGSGKTLNFSIVDASDVETNGASVSMGTVAGNLMSTANVSDLGKLTVSNPTIPASADTGVDPDNMDYTIATLQVASVAQALEVEKMKFTEIGSISKGDVVNFRLYYLGTLLSEVAEMNDAYEVEFDMTDAPLELTKGQTKTLDIKADIVKGSTRQFKMTVQNAYDVKVKDAEYGVYVNPYAGGSDGAGWAVVQGASSADWLISEGSLSISRSTTAPSGEVVLDGTNVVLGEWLFRASGEDMKVKDMSVTADTSDGASVSGIDNGKIYVDGVQLGNTKDLTDDNSPTTGDPITSWGFGSSFIVKAGETATVQVIGDVKQSDSTSHTNGTTVRLNILTSASNIQMMSSLGYNGEITAVYGSASTLSITDATLTITKYSGYGNQTMVAGTNEARLGSFVIMAGASEGATVSSITATLTAAEAASISNMYLKDRISGEMLGTVKVSPSTSNAISVNFELAAAGSKVVDVHADIKAGSDAGPWNAAMTATGAGKITSGAVTASSATLQTVTVGSGVLYANNGSHPSADILLGGSTDNYMAEFTMSASNEGFTVEKLKIKTESNFATSTAAVRIKYEDKDGVEQSVNGVFISAAAEAYATATFVGLDMYVPADDEVSLKVYLDMTTVANGATSGAVGDIYLDYNEGFQATGDAGTAVTTPNGSSADLDGNTYFVRKTKPTIAKSANLTSPVGGVIYEFTVVADSNGNVEIKQVGFTVTTSGVDVTDMYLYDKDASATLTDVALDADGDGNVKLLVGTSGAASTADEVIRVGTTAKTYQVRSTVGANSTWTTGDSITVKFNPDASTAALYATDAATVLAHAQGAITWSDRSAANHTTATSDWTNGYLLKDLDSSQAFIN